MNQSTNKLEARYESLRETQPNIRIRSAAESLGVSELELLELGLGDSVIRLEGGWKALLKEVHELGYVMALTRNEYVVHERKGVYHNVSFMEGSDMGVAVNPDIDLRFLMWDWVYGYAVELAKKNGTLYGLQFFNKYGEAVHKIYLTDQSNVEAYQSLLGRYRAVDQESITEVERAGEQTKAETKLSSEEVASFQQDWLDLKDTHDFFPLLRKYKLGRTQALRYAPEGHAVKVSNDSIVKVFEQAADIELPIMVFVNSSGCIQIHTGPVKKLVEMGSWFNVMDPEFNLHLNLEGVAETWVVRKPTVDGIVTGVEVFDKDGNMLVYCFGKRKPGKPELGGWRTLVADLEKEFALA